jgi:patatin-related protein
VHDQKYRHVLRFRYLSGNGPRDDFAVNAELAFAARATSSLPGGFSPAQLGDLKRVLKDDVARNGEAPVDVEDFISRQFREYALAGADARHTCFADGGILDNQPFSNAIRAIAKRSATRQVVRRILYIDPHPISEPAPTDGRLPGTFETLLGSLSRIPKHEPVHDEIWALNGFNRRIHRINDTVESSRGIVERLVREVGEIYGLELKADTQVLEKWRQAVNRHASSLEVAGYASYVGFKLRSMADELAAVICQQLNYPLNSGHALFVVNILKAWMERRRLLPVGASINEDQRAFLRLFDIGFRRRRVRFLIKDINARYRLARRPGHRPNTDDLDGLKHALYDLLDKYHSNLRGGDQEAALFPLLEAAFGETLLTPLLQAGRVDAQDFLDHHGDKVDGYYATLRNAIWDDKTPLHQLLSTIVAGCADWPEPVAREFLTRFVAFPFWDVMIFPLSDMGDVGELYEIRGVRMSPNDSRLVIDGGAEKKLRGVRYQHFGAFFSRYARENDYLWGRLDAAERLIDILVDAALEDTEHNVPTDRYLAEKTLALDAVLNAEESHLHVLKSRISALRRMLNRSKAPRPS